MQTIQFILNFPEQFQSKTTLEVKHQLNKSCKRKKGKKMIEVILSILEKSSAIIQIINPDLLNSYHYKTIYYSISLLYILSNIYIKYKNRKV